MLTIEPSGDRLLVRRLEPAESVSSGGILIPQSARQKSQKAIVVALGTGEWRDGVLRRPPFECGDVVVLGEYSGSDVRIGGIDHLVVRSDEVLGRVRDVPEVAPLVPLAGLAEI